MKYNIGDKVWLPLFEQYATEEVVCPDCCGKKSIKVIFGDGTAYDVPCTTCAKRSEYSFEEYSLGYILVHLSKPEVKEHTISGIETDGISTEYKMRLGGCSYRTAKEDGICDTKEEAEIKAQQLAEEYRLRQIGDINNRKHNDKRSWAWNASYHRKQIKQAEDSIEYNKKKLGIKHHPCGSIFYNPGGDEPDPKCKECGDERHKKWKQYSSGGARYRLWD